MPLHSGLMSTWILCCLGGSAAFTGCIKQKEVMMMALNLGGTALPLHSLSCNRSLAACVVKHDVNGGFTAGILAHRMSQNGRVEPLADVGVAHRLGTTHF